MDSSAIGQRLRQLRLERGGRQAEVAKQLGISPAYLNLIEKGKRSVQFPLLWKALELFGQDLEGFMASLGERRPDVIVQTWRATPSDIREIRSFGYEPIGRDAFVRTGTSMVDVAKLREAFADFDRTAPPAPRPQR